MLSSRLAVSAAAVAILGTAACAAGSSSAVDARARPVGARAEAVLRDSAGRSVGVATLVERSDGVSVGVSVTGLPPGPHGLHIHERGACTAPDFASAGGHFAPAGRPHGAQTDGGPHAGDLPNLVVSGDGAGRLATHNGRVTLGAGAAGLFDGDGSAIVVHAGPDDGRSQPSGASGARIACGVIERR